MAKPKHKFKPQQKQQQQKAAGPKKVFRLPDIPGILPFNDFRKQAVILVVIGLIFYANSFYNKYALDDDIVITQNEYVQKGFGGIGKIMSTDAYDSYYRSLGSSGELSGGRYRPLSIVTFAIEQAFIGQGVGDSIGWNENGKYVRGRITKLEAGQLFADAKNAKGEVEHKKVLIADVDEYFREPFVRHVMNVLLYIFSAIALLYFLRSFIFKNYPDLAFFTALIFIIHPLHTEVVANVKSRDEILSFFFMALTFIYAFRHRENNNIITLIKALVLFFCVLLSKEYGITLVVLLPAMFFIFLGYDLKKSAAAGVPYLLVALLFLAIRYSVVGSGRNIPITEPLNNPFVFANPSEALATKIFILDKYLGLLLFPHPLSADYSWATIAYRSFSDLSVWLSFFVHAGMIFFGYTLLRKRHLLAFAILFYLFHLALVSNFFMPLGATMGERLIYHSSFGFAIAAGYFILEGIRRLPSLPLQKGLSVAVAAALVVPCGYITIKRNEDWHDTDVLFLHDANVVPNSVLANGNAGKAYILYAEKAEKAGDVSKEHVMLDSALTKLRKAVKFHPRFVNGFFNLGYAYYKLDNLDSAEYCWNEARKNFPSHPNFPNVYDPLLAHGFVNRAVEAGQKNDFVTAEKFSERALQYSPNNPETWEKYAGANLSLGRLDTARQGFEKSLALNPQYTNARLGLSSVWYFMGQRAFAAKDPAKAREDFERSLQYNPNMKDAREALQKISGNK